MCGASEECNHAIQSITLDLIFDRLVNLHTSRMSRQIGLRFRDIFADRHYIHEHGKASQPLIPEDYNVHIGRERSSFITALFIISEYIFNREWDRFQFYVSPAGNFSRGVHRLCAGVCVLRR